VASDAPREVRERFEHVLLALEMLTQRARPWEQQRRIAEIGLASARWLAEALLPSAETREPSQS
jgi:hypothetical protein